MYQSLRVAFCGGLPRRHCRLSIRAAAMASDVSPVRMFTLPSAGCGGLLDAPLSAAARRALLGGLVIAFHFLASGASERRWLAGSASATRIVLGRVCDDAGPSQDHRRAAINRRSSMREAPPLALRGGRILLEQLVHGLREILLALLGLRVRVDRLARPAAPHELLGGAVVHVEPQRADCDRRGSRGSHAPAVPAAVIARSPAPPGTTRRVRVQLFLLVERDLVADI